MNRNRQRFLEKCFPEPNSGCWIWTGALDVNGYARFSMYGRNWKASRAAYVLLKIDDPKDLFVLHRCDNATCVNPDHLFLGTQKENMDDRDRKGRQADKSGKKNGCYGERNPQGKLDREQVLQIRSCDGKLSYREIGARFGISAMTAYKIAKRRTWRWLP